MATLTETAYYTRKFTKYGIVALGIFLFLKFSLKFALNLWRKSHPLPPPPPTVAFGKIPKITFPEQKDLPRLSFKLETIEGTFPKLPQVGKVYLLIPKKLNLLSTQRAIELAKKMGFSDSPEKVNSTLYRFYSPYKVLEIDISTGNFHLLHRYQNDLEFLKGQNLPSYQQAAQEAKNFLSNFNLLSKDLAEGETQFELLRFIPPDTFQSVTSLSEANLLRVNFFRKNLDDLKILPPNLKNSLVSFLLSGSREPERRILEINYTYFSIEEEISATYPLKAVSQAWEELQNGQGYISNLGENENESIVVRKIYLAFYDPHQSQNYLQPIYVFEGDKNFLGYVAALDPKWTE